MAWAKIEWGWRQRRDTLRGDKTREDMIDKDGIE